ncbi:MAG: response regulator, partial [Verrucomicrobiales bacterium]
MKALETFIKQARFLIVDDEITNVCLLEETLIDEGLNEFVSTTDSRKAADLFREFQPDIVLLDLMMPYLSGFEVLDRINSLIPPDQLVPVIILTADITPATRNRALKSGARDFLTKPLDPDELILRCRNLL